MSQSKFAGIYVKLQFQFSGISAGDGTSVTCPSGFPPKNTYVRSAPWCSTVPYRRRTHVNHKDGTCTEGSRRIPTHHHRLVRVMDPCRLHILDYICVPTLKITKNSPKSPKTRQLQNPTFREPAPFLFSDNNNDDPLH